MLTAIPSPPQAVWYVGPIPLRAYALSIIVGVVVAIYWANKRFIARGGRPGVITDLAIWMVPFGLIGGRLYHVISNPELYFGDPAIQGHRWDPWGVFAIWNGGLGIWGAIAFGALGAYLGARRYKVPFGAVLDAGAPAVVLAQGIGRLGNYFNQELFGSKTSLPWALEVYLRRPHGVIPGISDATDATSDQIAIAAAQYCGNGEFPTDWIKTTPEVLCGTYHPTFLYELLWAIGVALVVVWADRRFRLGHGRAFAVYAAGYTAGRAWIEMLRIDHANHILGLRLNVFVSVAVFVAAIVFLVATRGKGRENPADVRGPDPDSDAEPGRAAETGAVTESGTATDTPSDSLAAEEEDSPR